LIYLLFIMLVLCKVIGQLMSFSRTRCLFSCGDCFQSSRWHEQVSGNIIF